MKFLKPCDLCGERFRPDYRGRLCPDCKKAKYKLSHIKTSITYKLRTQRRLKYKLFLTEHKRTNLINKLERLKLKITKLKKEKRQMSYLEQ